MVWQVTMMTTIYTLMRDSWTSRLRRVFCKYKGMSEEMHILLRYLILKSIAILRHYRVLVKIFQVLLNFPINSILAIIISSSLHTCRWWCSRLSRRWLGTRCWGWCSSTRHRYWGTSSWSSCPLLSAQGHQTDIGPRTCQDEEDLSVTGSDLGEERTSCNHGRMCDWDLSIEYLLVLDRKL